MRRNFVFLVLVSLLAAGCASNDGGEGGMEAGTAPSAVRFSQVDLGAGGPQPVVVVAPEGTHVYVAAQDARGGGPRVWVSTDGGTTFSMKRPTTQGGGEVDLAAGRWGSVYLTQSGTQGTIVSVSHDHGETWRTAPVDGPAQSVGRQWLAVDERGRAYAVARQVGQAAAASTSRSDDGGLTWIPQGDAWDRAREPGLANGNLLAARNSLYLPYICRDGEGVCLATSRDAGATWVQSLVAERHVGTDNVYPVVAVTNAGVVVAWSDATEGQLAVHTAYSTDGRGGWSAPVRVSPPGITASVGWVTARGSEAYVVYLATDKRLSLTDETAAEDARWFPVARPLDARGANPEEEIHLSDLPVHEGVISKPVGGDGIRDRNFGDFFTAALSDDGRLLVAVSYNEGTPESTRDWVFVEQT